MISTLHTAVATGPGFTQMVNSVRAVYSAEIRFSALPNLRFSQFATRKEELGTQPGRQIVMQKMGGIRRGDYLEEGVRMKANSMSMTEQSITVKEVGNALAFSEYLLQVSFYDNMAAASMLLGRDMALVLDSQLRDVVRTATTKIYGNGKTSRNNLVVGDVFTTAEVDLAVEQLETNNVPKWNNDFYICFAHPHQLATLRKSPGWINLQYYSGGERVFFGEVGRYNDVRFISTSMMPNGKTSALDAATGEYADPGYDPALDPVVTLTLNTGCVVYQALMFGEFTYGHAVALPVELRDNGVVDHGREHGLAWYAIWGHGLLEVANCVVIETN
jgi:N4-gp56 family major capsid protein